MLTRRACYVFMKKVKPSITLPGKTVAILASTYIQITKVTINQLVKSLQDIKNL